MSKNRKLKNSSEKTLGKITSPIVLKTFLVVAVISAVAFVASNSLTAEVAAKVNGKVISLDDYNKVLAGQEKYRSQQKDDSYKEENVKKAALDELIENEVIIQEAEKLGINVTEQDVEEDYVDRVRANESESKLLKLISENYDYSKEDFKKYTTRPKLYEDRLKYKIENSDEIHNEAKAQADNISSQLKNGAAFAEMVEKYTDQKRPEQNSDLGWIGKGEKVKEFEDRAFSLNVGEVSESFKTVYGYHIIKVDDKKDDNVYVRQILI